MNCVVAGYGSIGQRHTKVLRQLGCKVAVVSRREIPEETVYHNLGTALEQENPGIVVLSDQTGEHYDQLEQLAGYDFRGNVLVEKPLFHTFLDIPANHFAHACVGYNLRFHPILRKVAGIVQQEKVLCAQLYTGQYLPDWRPGRDYREGYSARRNDGGGVLLDLSHELDFLQYLFGDWNRLVASGGKYSSLEIDSDDAFGILLEMEKCPLAQVQLNYLDRTPRREITVITENCSIRADLMAQTLQINRELIHYQLGRDETYCMQDKAVFMGEWEQLCTLEQGLTVLKTACAAEQSAKRGTWVTR